MLKGCLYLIYIYFFDAGLAEQLLEASSTLRSLYFILFSLSL